MSTLASPASPSTPGTRARKKMAEIQNRAQSEFKSNKEQQKLIKSIKKNRHRPGDVVEIFVPIKHVPCEDDSEDETEQSRRSKRILCLKSGDFTPNDSPVTKGDVNVTEGMIENKENSEEKSQSFFVPFKAKDINEVRRTVIAVAEKSEMRAKELRNQGMFTHTQSPSLLTKSRGHEQRKKAEAELASVEEPLNEARNRLQLTAMEVSRIHANEEQFNDELENEILGSWTGLTTQPFTPLFQTEQRAAFHPSTKKKKKKKVVKEHSAFDSWSDNEEEEEEAENFKMFKASEYHAEQAKIRERIMAKSQQYVPRHRSLTVPKSPQFSTSSRKAVRGGHRHETKESEVHVSNDAQVAMFRPSEYHAQEAKKRERILRKSVKKPVRPRLTIPYSPQFSTHKRSEMKKRGDQ